jgi:carbon-monoxide dehydrogenase large subunit
VFVIERLMDAIARTLELDRAEVRRRNLVGAEEMPYAKPLITRGGIKVELDSGDYPRCQEEALAKAEWDYFRVRQKQAREVGRYLGIGLANYVEGTGRGPFEPVTVRVGPSGRVQVVSSAVAMGQGTRTMLAQVVAEALGTDLRAIAVITGDTGAIPLGFGGFNSRQAVMAGSSAHVAALKVREKLLEVAGHMLEVSSADLEIDSAAVRLKGSDVRVTFAEVARAAAGTPGYRLPGNIAPGLEASGEVVIDPMAYANGSAVVEVEVDRETGHVTVNAVVLVHDCGRVIHPQIVDGQVVGGAIHGLGNALFEHMRYDAGGQPVTANLADYLLVTATEAPCVEVVHLASPTALNPLGIKGVGEAGVLPIPAAIAAAIEDALSPFGVRITRAPIAPHEIVELINSSRRVGKGGRDAAR